MDIKYTEEQLLIIQTYSNFLLWKDLERNSLKTSIFFKKLVPQQDSVKQFIKKEGVFNLGLVHICLYALLCVPHEIFKKESKKNKVYMLKFDEINNFISSELKVKPQIYTYPYQKIDFLRHIRNSISHANFEYTDTPNHIMFRDKDDSWDKSIKKKRDYKFECIFRLDSLDQILHKLAEIFEIYITSIAEIHQST